MSNIYRGWINQPSTNQNLHYFHGTKVLIESVFGISTVRIYFLEGMTISMEVPRNCNSKEDGNESYLSK